jgi:hypothetical protein
LDHERPNDRNATIADLKESSFMKYLTSICFGILMSIFMSPAFATFIDNHDGTVTDTITGLIWKRCSEGQSWNGSTCSGMASTYTFSQAIALTNTFAGQSDWRLPNIRELHSIVNRSAYPTIDSTAFPNSDSATVWSSSVDAVSSNFVWGVGFSYGYDGDFYTVSSAFEARLVRGQPLTLANPNTEYTDNGDGTVTHNPTGLMWKRCSEGQTWDGSNCTGMASAFNWNQAMAITSNFAGKSDWRLPTEVELISLLDYTLPSLINSTIFPNTPSQSFWSSTADASYSGYFGNGSFDVGIGSGLGVGGGLNTYTYHARLVRIGQVNLVAGWNMLGNGSSVAIDIANTFGGNNNVTTVWKWNNAASKWAFYTPSMTSSALTAYTTNKGYDVLASIESKEGFWVNTSAATSMPSPAATGSTLVEGDLQQGWNLMGSADNKTPSQLNQSLNITLNTAGKAIVTAWTWDARSLMWKFYSPALEYLGGTALPDYINVKNYLPFDTAPSFMDGFWLNIGAASAPLVTLSAAPSSIANGATSTLNWASTNSTSCSSSGGGGTGISGSFTTPSLSTTTTYTVTCTGSGGSATQSATVTVADPLPVVTLSATPSSIVNGATSTLNWTSTNSTSCSSSGGGGTGTSGSFTTPPLSTTTTYTVTCTGSGGSATQSATVTVTGAYVAQGGLTWMPVSFWMSWYSANNYCLSFNGLGKSGWRLPTNNELSALYASGAMNGQGWILDETWSSTSDGGGYNYSVYLNNGLVGDGGYSSYVTCVR